MREIQSNGGAAGYPAGLSFATLEQTASSRVNHLGRSVAVAPQPVVLELGYLCPPAYSEIDQAPPPPYLEATGQINRPREEESTSIPNQPEEDSYRKFQKRITCYFVTGVLLILASYVTYRAVVTS